MGKQPKFSMGAFAESLALSDASAPAAEAVRDIEAVTAEIIQLKQTAGEAIIGIGKRLMEAKEMLPHGEWLSWLTEQVEFSPRTARNYMQIAREWTNRQSLANLGAAKALALLALPPKEREDFIEETHLVDGEEKTVIDMTSRELKKALQERDEARRAAEAAQADARTAEESRAKMEADMRALENIHKAAQEGEAQARDALAKAQEELQALRDRPVDVAVEAVVDEEAVAKARAEAIAEMKAKVDKAEAERKAAEAKRKDVERALTDAKKQVDASAAAVSRAENAERELAEARRQLASAAKSEVQAAISSDGDLAFFNLLFGQIQNEWNQLNGIRMKVQKRDEVAAGKLRTAMLAMLDAMRRGVE